MEKNKDKKLKPSVFISYSRNDINILTNFLKNLEEDFDNKGIEIINDQINLDYKGSINDFMKKDGLGKFVILLITENYLKSKSCMFEFNEILRNQNFNNRYFPIITKEANLFSPENRINYIHFWDNKINELESNIKTFKGNKNEFNAIYYNLNIYSTIRNNVAHNLNNLTNMHVYEIDEIYDQTIKLLSKSIETKIKLDKINTEGNE